jgi:hypothetical protein
MSTINTNGIDVNYPIPGVNNSTQGFRDNFTAIKTNLNTAGTEITDLQNKVVLKSALANSTLNNDMANTLIANASTLQFRATTYNLGNALVGAVLVDCSLGDLQYGNLNGNVVLNFGSWAPTNTQSTVKLQLGRPNNEANYSITFSGNAQINQNSGWGLLENSGSNGGLASITFPYDTTQIDLTVTSTDCGTTLFVEPTNRPYKTTAVQSRTPPPTGFLGDVAGTVAVDANYFYVCTANFDSTTYSGNAVSTTTGTNIISFGAALSGSVTTNMPVVFDTMYINGVSVTSFAGIQSGQVYYVKTKPTSQTITISDTRSLVEGPPGTFVPTAGNTFALTTVAANAGQTYMDATFYSGSNIWKRISLTSW